MKGIAGGEKSAERKKESESSLLLRRLEFNTDQDWGGVGGVCVGVGWNAVTVEVERSDCGQ